jgi:hypothetical protein
VTERDERRQKLTVNIFTDLCRSVCEEFFFPTLYCCCVMRIFLLNTSHFFLLISKNKSNNSFLCFNLEIVSSYYYCRAMISIHARCDGAFIGHAIASNYDPSIFLALNISESLLGNKRFNGPDILSKYLFLYHTQRSEVGATTKYIYQVAVNNVSNKGKTSLTPQDFLFDQSIINETVKMADKNLGGLTAGCGAAQRSFPLALCPSISDDDLFGLSMEEAALTHYSPLAGQVAGVVNLICRSLFRNKTWHEAVHFAFSQPSLNPDVTNIHSRYSRSPGPYVKTDPAYAPTALNAALYYITNSKNAVEAIETARANDKHFCAPIVGILSGARWGVPLEMYKGSSTDPQLKTIRDIANRLGDLWPSQHDNVVV